MDLAILASVFITSNIWGLYAAIPFTAIQPSRSFLDRAVASFQLTSTLHMLGHIHPYLLGKATSKEEPMCLLDERDESILHDAMADCIHSKENEVATDVITATRIDNTSFATPMPILDEHQEYHHNKHLRSEQLSEPESVKTESVHNTNTMVLTILIVILSIQINDTMRRPTGTTTEIRLLRQDIQTLTTELENYHGATMHQCLERLAQIREGMNQLFTVGNALLALPDRLPRAVALSVASNVAEQLNNPSSDMARHLREIQDNLRQFHDGVVQNVETWKELSELLGRLPSAISSAITSSVADEIAGSNQMVSAKKTTATTTNIANGRDFRHSIWADQN